MKKNREKFIKSDTPTHPPSQFMNHFFLLPYDKSARMSLFCRRRKNRKIQFFLEMAFLRGDVGMKKWPLFCIGPKFIWSLIYGPRCPSKSFCWSNWCDSGWFDWKLEREDPNLQVGLASTSMLLGLVPLEFLLAVFPTGKLSSWSVGIKMGRYPGDHICLQL